MNIQWSTFHTPYTENAVRRVVPTRSGVYLLWVKYKNGNWKCFYVGKSENLEERLLQHLSTSEDNDCVKENVRYTSGFYWAEVPRGSDRSGIEKALYDYYKTECNKNDPGGTPIHVNVPSTPT